MSDERPRPAMISSSSPVVSPAEAGRVLGDVLREPRAIAGVGRCTVRQGRVPNDQVAGVGGAAPRFGGEIATAGIDTLAQAPQPGVDALVEARHRLERALLGLRIGEVNYS